jgi:uncharacterized protein (DUF2141 family)
MLCYNHSYGLELSLFEHRPMNATYRTKALFVGAALAVLTPFSAHAEDIPAADAPPTVPCDQLAYSIALTVKGVKSSQGIVTVDLHNDDPDKWLSKGGRVGRVRAPAMEGETRICIPVSKPGTYAFALYHDKDANLKLNKNWIGLPSEPFGVSNDAPIRLGPPSLKDASLQVTGPAAPATVTLSK